MADTPDPVVSQGQVWTVAQWNAFFASQLQVSNNLGEIAAAGPAAQAAALANIGALGTSPGGQFSIVLSGAAGDGVTDDQPKIQAWLNALAVQFPGGCEILLPSGSFYLINSAPLTIPKHFIVRGTYNAQDNQTAGGPFFGAGGFLINPALNAGIIMSATSTLRSCKVYRAGLIANATAAQVTTAVAAWAAEAFYLQTNGSMAAHATVIPLANTTGITVGMQATGPGGIGVGSFTVQSIILNTSVTINSNPSAAVLPSGTWFRFGGSIGISIGYNNSANVIDEVMVVGFSTGIQAFPGQFWISRVHADCITCLEACSGGDTASVRDCEFLPFYGNATGSANRPGTAVFVHDGNVSANFYNVFSFGWLTGWHLANVQGGFADRCGAESLDGSGTVNWFIDGGSQISLFGCHAQSGGIGFNIQNSVNFYLAECSSASGPTVTGNNIAHFQVSSSGTNTYGALIAPTTLGNFPQKIPINLGTVAGCSIVAPVISDMAGSSPTAPFIQGAMPFSTTPNFIQGAPYAGLASGNTQTVIWYENGAIIDSGGGTLTTLTLAFPPFPCDGQTLEFWFNVAVTTLSITTSDSSAVGHIANPAAGTYQKWIYNGAQNKWFG